ncbi:MAG TPA: hypothetical protein VH519_11825 [Hyphomicrobiaceae bacterium]
MRWWLRRPVDEPGGDLGPRRGSGDHRFVQVSARPTAQAGNSPTIDRRQWAGDNGLGDNGLGDNGLDDKD